MEILVVDPSASYRKIIKEILTSEDVRVVEAINGQEALDYLKQSKPNAISVAYEFGDMDAFTFLNKIKRKTTLDTIPKFLLTSNATKEFKRKAYDTGFTEIFFKSDFQTLKRAMRSLIATATTNITANVLYVEDTQSTADYTTHIMNNVGWTVTHVKSGEEAAKYLDDKACQFDLVVTDLVLEGHISGIGLIDLIRQGKESIRNIPILAVSGWNDLLRQVYVLRHGAGDFIAKPFHENDFLARAINLIQNKRQFDASRAKQKALYQQANLDAASGLNNRNFLEKYGAKYVEDAVERNLGLAVIILDVDDFKTINDTRGHLVGDVVIRQVSTLIKGLCHVNDFVVRYGGDEVVVLMDDCDHDDAANRAEMFRSQIAELRPEGLEVTCSIGVAVLHKKVEHQLLETLENITSLPTDEMMLDYETLFKAADHCLYVAKKAGRNQVCVNNILEGKEEIKE